MKAFDKKVGEREFERRMKLFQDDPAEFERRSRKEIEEAIQSAPPHLRRRLGGVQFQIDTTLARYKHPTARMNKMVELFWTQAKKLDDALQGLKHGRIPPQEKKNGKAKVIPFSAKDR